MQQLRDKAVDFRVALIMVAALGAFALLIMIMSARYRGIWIDEIWSLWITRRDIPFPDIEYTRWAKDNHPPLFYAAAWMLNGIAGDSIFISRMENVVPIVLVVAGLFLISRGREGVVGFSLTFFVLVFVGIEAGKLFPEFRSYFSQLCAVYMIVVCLFSVHQSKNDFKFDQDSDLAIIFVVSALLSLNLHYICSFVVGVLLGVFVVQQVVARRWRWAGLLLAGGLLAAAPLGAALYLSAKFVRANVGSFWIDTSPSEAALIIARTLAHGAAYNVVAALAAVLGLSAAIRSVRAGRNSNAPVTAAAAHWRRTASFAICVSIALAISVAVIFTVNLVRPIVVDRYLTAIVPLVASLVAAFAADQLLASRAAFALFVLNAAALGVGEGRKMIAEKRWELTAQYIQDQVRACPDARVYALDPTMFRGFKGPVDQRWPQEWGYRKVARDHGFSIRDLQRGDRRPITLSSGCPTLLWDEHGSPSDLADLRSAPFVRNLPPEAPISSVRVFTGDGGYVFALPPTQGAASANPAKTSKRPN